jgi:hypothetical protein
LVTVTTTNPNIIFLPISTSTYNLEPHKSRLDFHFLNCFFLLIPFASLLLNSRPTMSQPKNHAALYLILNFTLSYYILSTRLLRRYYGFDNNVSPRQDIAKHGEKMVKEGKVTRSALERIKRMEGAHENSMAHFAMFGISVVSIFRFCLGLILDERRATETILRIPTIDLC